MMIDLHERYLTDAEGNRVGVILDMETFRRVHAALAELDDLHATGTTSNFPKDFDLLELDADLYELVRERTVDPGQLSPGRPLTEQEQVAALAALDEIDELAAKIGAAWQDDMSAVDAVKEQRREL